MSFMCKSKGCGVWFVSSRRLCSLLWGFENPACVLAVALLLVLEKLRLERSWVLTPDGSSSPAEFKHFQHSGVKAISKH